MIPPGAVGDARGIVLNFTLGTFIGAHRLNLNMSQKELAKAVGISPQYLNDIEHGKRVPKDVGLLQDFAQALGVDLDVLCFMVGILPPNLPHVVRQSQIIAAFKAMREVLSK